MPPYAPFGCGLRTPSTSTVPSGGSSRVGGGAQSYEASFAIWREEGSDPAWAEVRANARDRWAVHISSARIAVILGGAGLMEQGVAESRQVRCTGVRGIGPDCNADSQ